MEPFKAPSLAIMPHPLPPDRHPAHVYLARLGPGSRRTITEALNAIARIVINGPATLEVMPSAELRYQHTEALRAVLIKKYKPSTAAKILAALRGVLREAWRLDQMTAEEFHRAADIPPIKIPTLPPVRALGSREIADLMRVCIDDDSAAGVRDGALIACLYGTGLRRSEAVALDVSNYNAEARGLTIS